MVLTNRFWTTTLGPIRRSSARQSGWDAGRRRLSACSSHRFRIPSETEIIANVVTSPHHMAATMVTGRVHRMTELFGRLAPGADLETARAELRAVHGAIVKEYPEAYSPKADFRIDAVKLREQITSPAQTILLVLLAASAIGLHHCLLERRESDSGAIGSSGRRACGSGGLGREHRRAASNAARRESGVVRRWRGSRRPHRSSDGVDSGALCVALFGQSALT